MFESIHEIKQSLYQEINHEFQHERSFVYWDKSISKGFILRIGRTQ